VFIRLYVFAATGLDFRIDSVNISGEYEIEASEMRRGKLIEGTIIAWKFDPSTEQVGTFFETMMTTE
jgi:hypothetical protein